MSAVASPVPQFGRAWRLEVRTSPDASGNSSLVSAFSDAWQPEPLKLTFEIGARVVGKSGWAYADIVVYNLNDATEQLVLTQGMGVTLWAGYQSQPYGVIFDGTLFQPLWERENVVDFKLTLHCIVALDSTANNFVNTAIGQNMNQRQIVARMAANAHVATQPVFDDPASLTATTYPRGQVLFGDPNKFFDDVSAENNINHWVEENQSNFSTLQTAAAVPTYTFGPGTGLVGTPQVTQDGVSCRVLLDPRIHLGEKIKLDMSLIRQLPRVPGSFPTILSHDGIYTVASISHTGDTRGNSWYTELVGITSVGGKLAVLAGL